LSIIINNLSKSYNNKLVLDNLSLTINKGSVFGLLGPNGAGKTTLVSILNQLINKDSGSIEIFGFNIETNSCEIKQISSYIPQTYAFYPNLSAFENLEFFGALYGLKGELLKQQIAYCIETTGLTKFIHAKAGTFSGGVKRRLNIAIGLLNSPKIIYLDEPTVGIDPQSRKYILDVIKNLNKTKETTIVYTSHYMDEIEYLCDEIAILDHKKIILQEKHSFPLKKQSLLKIQLEKSSIQMDVSDSYDEFMAFVANLKQENKKILSLDFLNENSNSLENRFLSLTKEELRD